MTNVIAACSAAFCAGAQVETGKLLLTGGVSSIDGAAGGGLTPWAVIGSNATDGEIGGSAFMTNAGARDYGLCGSRCDRARQHRKPQAGRLLAVGVSCFLNKTFNFSKFIMKKTLIYLSLAASSVLFAGAVMAQTAAAKDDQLYKAFGENAGLVALMDDFMVRLLADARTGPHFKPANQQRIKEQLVNQLCSLSGGPCVYRGADMKSSHANLDIKKSDFHALVEMLQTSMDAQGIPSRKQNEILGLLAPDAS